VLAHRPSGAAVGQGPLEREVEPVVATLEPRAVDGALARLGRGTAALRALPGRSMGVLLEEERLDASVGGRLERLAPAGRRPPAAAGLLAPALDLLALTSRPGLLEHGLHHGEELRRPRVRL